MKQIITLLLAFFTTVITAQTVDIAGTPYASISAAVTAAVDGDVINITGTHTGLVVINNKSITLRGTNPATDIIQAAAAPASTGAGTRVILLTGTPPTALNIAIENLTIRNGNFNANGGGIFADKIIGLVTLKNLIITNNFTSTNGGGIGLAGSNATIIDCTIQNNTSTQDGGGIIAAPNNASGVSNVVNIKQSLINANTGRNGGGIFINGNNGFGNNYKIEVNVENSTISNNNSTSATGGNGGGSILSTSALWTTIAGGDGTSGNVSLRLIHTTVYKNSHINVAKAGIVFLAQPTYFSAYNSIVVNDSDVNSRAINFLNASTSNVVNCILGGLQNADLSFLDAAPRNNQRGKTASEAGLSGTLANLGGSTAVLEISAGSAAHNFCTATITGVTIPNVDQRGFLREGVQDAGSFERPTTTWISSQNWTNGVPTLAVEATIDAPYDSAIHGGGFFALNLKVTPNGSINLRSGDNIRVENEVVNNSSLGASGFVIQNNANLRQNNPSIVNTTPIKMIRSSNPLMRLDYTLWSSPVQGQNLLAFSPLTFTNRFYTYNSATNLYSPIVPSTNNFSPGAGYLIRMPDNHPTTATIWSGTFEGIPNNGVLSVPLTTDGANKRFNLVGNPYPSPITMESFVLANASRITQTLYFWRRTNNTSNGNVYNTWVGGTFIATAEPFGNVDPDGIIRNGQGFFVEASADNVTPLVFNNGMRTLENNNQFFRNASSEVTNDEEPTEKHRIWLNLTDATGYFYQQAISYIDGGTAAVDQFDGKSISSGDMLFNSIIPNATSYYAIQSRALPFDTNDTVPLSVKVTTPGAYSISVADKDGLFADGTQAIFLKDNVQNTLVNLNNGAYNFNALAGTFDNRFELQYTNSALNNQDFAVTDVVVYQNNAKELVVKTGGTLIESIALYDLAGRLIVVNKEINQTTFNMNIEALTNQVVLVQIKDVNGVVVTKKIIR
jgi:hypothetical protein